MSATSHRARVVSSGAGRGWLVALGLLFLGYSGCYAYQPCHRNPWWGGGGGGCGCGQCGGCAMNGGYSGEQICGPVVEGPTASAPVYADNGEPYNGVRTGEPTLAARGRNPINVNNRRSVVEETEPAPTKPPTVKKYPRAPKPVANETDPN